MSALRGARRIDNPAARAAAAAAATVWLAFWLLTTLPLHLALCTIGRRGGFIRPGRGYIVPWWAMLAVALVVTAPITTALVP